MKSLAGLFAVLLWASTPCFGAAQGSDSLRQVAGILDYIAGDYRGAVGPRRDILDQDELTEQRSLAKDADALAEQAGVAPGTGVRAVLVELAAALDQVGSPDQIADVCARARATLVAQHGVTLAPNTLPNRERAARLYQTSGCTSCHGVDGSANTDAAKKLDPPPANFLDPERVSTVSAHRAFFAITYGVSGTAMTSYRNLDEADRWSLAFYVLSLRHPASLSTRGKQVFAQGTIDQPKSARALATLTDDELRAKLKTAGPNLDAALAYLRYAAPFETDASASGSLGSLRRALHAALETYQAGNQAEARRQFVAAYLDQLEPQEPVIRARSPELVGTMEKTMLALREAAARHDQATAITEHVAAMDRLIDQAEGQKTSPTAALIGALTITLREGLEIALLIGALLGLVRKRGQPQLVKYVHAGWVLAVVAGLLTWMLAGSLLGGLERELAEGIAAIAAATMLLGVTHWLLGQLTAKRFMGFVGGQLNTSLAGSSTAPPGDGLRRAKMGVLSLSFVAAYREAFEVVLFFQALLLDARDAHNHVWLGVAVGSVILVAATFALKAVGQRLQPRPFMLASSGLLAVLAVVLIGKGIRALQEAGVIGLSSFAQFELPTLGIHATIEGMLAQGILVTLLLASAFWAWRQDRRDASTTPTAAV